MRMRSAFDATVANLGNLTPTQHWSLCLSFSLHPSASISNKSSSNVERCCKFAAAEYWEGVLIKICETVIERYCYRSPWKCCLSCKSVYQLYGINGGVGMLMEEIHLSCEQCR